MAVTHFGDHIEYCHIQYKSVENQQTLSLRKMLLRKVLSSQVPLQLHKPCSTQCCQEGGPCPLLFPSIPLPSQPAFKHVPTCPLVVIGVVLEDNFNDTALHTQPEGQPLPVGCNCCHNQLIHISHVWNGPNVQEGSGTWGGTQYFMAQTHTPHTATHTNTPHTHYYTHTHMHTHN